MGSYLGFSRDDLVAMFDYDPIEGIFTRKSDGRKLLDFKYACRDSQGNSVTLYLHRVACVLVDNLFLSDDDCVRFKDGNRFNMAYDNLVVAKRAGDNEPVSEHKYVETATEGVFYNPKSQLFVVRRGATQAIYRTFSYKEAIFVRKEWELDNKVHRYDFTMPDWFKNIGPYVKIKKT